MTVLVTGAAGFIGYSLADRLLADGATVTGIDNLTPYYDVSLKEARLDRLRRHTRFRFQRLDLAEREAAAAFFAAGRYETIVHLAAQAGVRYSYEQPLSFADANLLGFSHLLEGARIRKVRHLVFASSSSVYGANRKVPFSEEDRVDHPISFYAATKRANELAAHTYAHLHGIPCSGLRFFTVYGPWGRPDMALFKFTRLILAGEPIPVYNEGRMTRDFTFIDDIVEGIVRIIARPPAQGASAAEGTDAPYRLYNIGNGRPVELIEYIRTLEQCLGQPAQLELLAPVPGDMLATMADVSRLEAATGYRPVVTVAEGVRRFVAWYRDFYKVADTNGVLAP